MPFRTKEEKKEYHKKYIRKHYQENKEYYKNKNKQRKIGLAHERLLWENIRDRCKHLEIDFNIDIDDIVIPDKCPVFKRDLVKGDPRWSPSVDRLDPNKGYIKGNISVMSRRANWLKNNASLEEIEQLYFWYKTALSS